MSLYSPVKVSNQSISNLSSLAHVLGVSETEIIKVCNMPFEEKYLPLQKELYKSDGSPRSAFNPCPDLRKLQRRINNRIFSNTNVIGWPAHIYGSVPNTYSSKGEKQVKDYVTCARQHCLAKSVLKADIKDFFTNIHSELVYNIFFKFLKYPAEVSEALTDICTGNGHVVQGALTSSYIGCLCLFEAERKVVERLTNKGLTYTRLVDDITISTPLSSYDFTFARKIVEDMLADNDLPLNTKKTKIYYHSSAPILVHGLRISFNTPRLPGSEVRKIRAAVKDMEVLASSHSYRTSHSYRHDFNRVMGRVNKLKRVGHNQHGPLKRRLIKVYPLPSYKDIKRARTAVKNLIIDHPKRRSTYWYKKRYYRAQERINRLNLIFVNTAHELREKLFGFKPEYEK